MEGEKVCEVCRFPVPLDYRFHPNSLLCIANMQSRISTLEAALSLDDDKIEKIASAMWGVPIDRAPSSIAKMYRSHASTAIKELRELAGLEVSDGE